jgi:hypothetical protein
VSSISTWFIKGGILLHAWYDIKLNIILMYACLLGLHGGAKHYAYF